MAGFDPVKLKAFFAIPDDYVLMTVIAVAYPGGEAGLSEKHLETEHSQRARKSISEVIFPEVFPKDHA
jgi:hypothetical protein